MLRVISLGAGVQSTTMALMAARGELSPMPDCAIFADTQGEPAAVYKHLEWLRSPSVLPFPVHVVTQGNLTATIAAKRPKGKFLKVEIPAYVKGTNGTDAIIARHCTRDYKINPLDRKVKELLGLTRKRLPTEPVCERWIGISQDEIIRMKPSWYPWQTHRWPLIEKGMSRWDCLRWLEKKGYPKPPKSACTFCPFHSDDQWRALTKDEFAECVELDRKLREHPVEAYGRGGELFLHRSLKPLDQVDLSTAEDHGQLNLFNNECEGMCGV